MGCSWGKSCKAGRDDDARNAPSGSPRAGLFQSRANQGVKHTNVSGHGNAVCFLASGLQSFHTRQTVGDRFLDQNMHSCSQGGFRYERVCLGIRRDHKRLRDFALDQFLDPIKKLLTRQVHLRVVRPWHECDSPAPLSGLRAGHLEFWRAKCRMLQSHDGDSD